MPAPSGIGTLLLSYYDTLMRDVPHLAPEEQAATLKILANLVAAARERIARDPSGGDPNGREHDTRAALAAAQLTLAREVILRHAMNVELTPAFVAAELGISVRRLHRVFAGAGDTVSRHILHCRLEIARARLRSPACDHETILDLALDCGFASLPTFYRTFRATYGVPPAEYRRSKPR